MSEHITREQLQAWMAEDLAASEASVVEAHLESCDQCAAALEELDQPADPLEQRIREIAKGGLSGQSMGEQSPMSTGRMEQAGTKIGPYKLLELIGEGGMGSVWVAQQEQPVKRVVAVKIIKAGMDTKEVIARFESERQALSMMDHPNIARVLDAGATDTGRPYFVMEHVKGIPITEFCDQNKASLQQRLELLCATCSAVQHAHRKGVIHRDIKPTNVLVTLIDGSPEVKVIDFGLAKATGGNLTDKTLFTTLGQMVGTPAYMSPEQAESSALDIDTRSDVYSLGVLLYELLTGVTPLDLGRIQQAAYAEIQRIIREVDPPTPSTRLSSANGDRDFVASQRASEPRNLVHLLRGDLDVIVMKSLEKDRSRRYGSPAEFAADIRRFLKQEPIEARRASTLYRLGRMYQRKKPAFIAVGLIAASLVLGTITSSILAVQAMGANKLANERLEDVQREQKNVRAALNDSELARSKAESVSQLLIEVFESPNPSREGSEIKIADMLDRAAERLKTELSDQPDQQAELKMAIAKTYFALNLYDKAIPLLRDVSEYWTATKGADAEETIKAISSLADCHTRTGRYDDAIAIAESLVKSCKNRYGLDHELTLNSDNILATAMWRGGNASELGITVLKIREDIVERAKKSLGPDHSTTLVFMNNLANSYSQLNRFDEALKIRRAVLDSYEDRYGRESPRTIFTLMLLATVHRKNNDPEAAPPIAEQAFTLSESVLGETHDWTNRNMQVYGDLLWETGKKHESVVVFERSLRVRRRTNRLNDNTQATAFMNLIGKCGLAGLHEKALLLGQEQIASSTRALGPDHAKVLNCMSETARSVAAKPGASGDQLQEAHEMASALCQRKPRAAKYWRTLGMIQYREQDYEAALESLKKANQFYPGPMPHYFTAMTLWKVNEPDLARERLVIAEELFAKRKNKDAWTLAYQSEAKSLIEPSVKGQE